MSEQATTEKVAITTDGHTVADRYIAAYLRKKAADAVVKQIEAEMKTLQTQTTAWLHEQGATQATTANGYAIELGTQLWARAEEGQTRSVVQSLIARSMGEYVSYNISSLSALFRRMVKAGLALPKIKGLRIDEDATFSVRKAG
jgi:hypothetical protein